jgi:phage terminase large subunit GpA-like protein
MILMPDQKSAEDFKAERIDPLVSNTPAVKRHLTSRAWDDTKHRIRFDTMRHSFVWAGSKSGTKSRRSALICEEPDEYPPFSSTGGDPLSKAEKRLTTYRDKGREDPARRHADDADGNIWKRWEMCSVRYHYWVPCPHCNAYQLCSGNRSSGRRRSRAKTAPAARRAGEVGRPRLLRMRALQGAD